MKINSEWHALFFCIFFGTFFNVSAQTWISLTPPTSETLRAVHFINSNEGWAAGYGGVIYHTTNRGKDWTSQNTNTNTRFLSVRFTDANYGWANTGLKILRTEDGGTTWNDMIGPDPHAAIFRNKIFPVSSTVAWATAQCASCGPAQRWFYRYTATSATTVTEQTFGLIASGVQLIDLWFTDQDNGWAVGTSGQIWKITAASSESPVFTNQTNVNVTASTLYGVFFLDVNNGWAVGNNGTILATVNGGVSWSSLTGGTTTNLRDVHFIDHDHGCVVGENGEIRVTSDGGANWTPETSGVSTTLWSVVFVGSSPGFIVGGDFSTSGNGTILCQDMTPPAQKILLKTGWNIFSVHLSPENLDMKNIFQSLINDGSLIKVQDETGNSLEDMGVFGGWVNNIGDISLTEGYKVKVSQDCELELEGAEADLPMGIPLKTGWNIIGYPKQAEAEAKAVVQQLIDRGTLIKVQDEYGNAIEDLGVFGGWQNYIGNFKPGKGYKIKVTSNDTLTIF